MPDPARSRQIIPFAMMFSAVVLGVMGYLVFEGTVPVPETSRPIVGGVLAAAALADVFVAVWFFNKGQSS